MRRVARHGDGWLASAYNTSPELFAAGGAVLADAHRRRGRPGPLVNAIGTAWMYVTEDAGCAERMLADVLAPLLNRPVEALRSLSLPIGSAEVCAERLSAFAQAGAQRLFVWPLADELDQLRLFWERVVPQVESPLPAG